MTINEREPLCHNIKTKIIWHIENKVPVGSCVN